MSIPSVNEYWAKAPEEEARGGLPIIIQYADVEQLTGQGEPMIRLDGSDMVSPKIYQRMKHYIPAVGDRVQLINEIITGGWQP